MMTRFFASGSALFLLLFVLASAARAGGESSSSPKFVVPEHDLYPESIAHDAETGCYFLGSMSTSRIIRTRPDGSYEDFLEAPPDGLASSIGMKADAQRRRLWVCTGRFTLYADYASAAARTGVLLFDLDGGGLLQSWLIPQESDYHIFNDLDLAPDGAAYATTTLIGRVYRLVPGREEMELVLQLPPKSHNNGIALAPGGKALFMAVDRTIARLDLATGELSELVTEAGEGLGTDGLYVHGDALVSVKPRYDQVVRLTLDESCSAVVGSEILVQGHPGFAYPTTGVLVDDKLVFVATSFANVPRSPGADAQHADVLIHELDLPAPRE